MWHQPVTKDGTMLKEKRGAFAVDTDNFSFKYKSFFDQ